PGGPQKELVMALWAQLTRWMRRGDSPDRRRASLTRHNVVLRLESLEDRVVPSGGPGPTSTPGGSGSSGGPAAGGPTAPGATFTPKLAALSQAYGPTPLQQLLSGYPVPPSSGPNLSGGMLVVNDPSVLASLGNSTVALVPVTSPSGSGSTNLTLTLVNTATGA